MRPTQLLALLPLFRHNLNQPVRNTQKVCLGGTYPPTCQYQVSGSVEPNDSWKPVGPSCAGDYAEAGFRQPDLCCGGEDAKGGTEGKFEAAAESEGADSADGRDWED